MNMPSPTRILIVEDEFPVALDIETRLTKMGFISVGTTDNFEGAIAKAAVEKPDIVMMDIQISGDKTGIDTARVIWETFEIPVIYLTGMNDPETTEEAMNTRPMGYILKPFRDEDIRNQVYIALQQKAVLDDLRKRVKGYEEVMSSISKDQVKDEILFVKDNKQIQKIAMKNITYLEAMDNYTLIYTAGDKYIVNGFLKDVIGRIMSPGLVRIHRSYAVVKDHIDRIEENTVVIGDRILPVSRSYRDDFYTKINAI